LISVSVDIYFQDVVPIWITRPIRKGGQRVSLLDEFASRPGKRNLKKKKTVQKAFAQPVEIGMIADLCIINLNLVLASNDELDDRPIISKIRQRQPLRTKKPSLKIAKPKSLAKGKFSISSLILFFSIVRSERQGGCAL
jgi:hypothetical protein